MAFNLLYPFQKTNIFSKNRLLSACFFAIIHEQGEKRFEGAQGARRTDTVFFDQMVFALFCAEFGHVKDAKCCFHLDVAEAPFRERMHRFSLE